MMREPNAQFTDIREVLASIEDQLPGLSKPDQRRPMLTLYLLFHRFMNPGLHMTQSRRVWEKYAHELDAPSIESMVAHILTDTPTGWPTNEYERTYREYLDQRYRKDGLLLPPLLDLAAILTLAEMYRTAGDVPRALELFGEAVENCHGNITLLDFEKQYAATHGPIDWASILLLKPPERLVENTKTPGNGVDAVDDWQI